MAALARKPLFDWVAFVICVAYIVSLAFDYYMISEKMAKILQSIDFGCAILFIAETAIRLHSLRRKFLLSFWNFFDAVTVIFLLIGKNEFE